MKLIYPERSPIYYTEIWQISWGQIHYHLENSYVYRHKRQSEQFLGDRPANDF